MANRSQQPEGFRSRAAAAGNAGNAVLSDLNVQATTLQLELESLLYAELCNDAMAHKKNEDSLEELGSKLKEFQKTVETMERMIANQPDPVWRKRIESYRQLCAQFHGKLEAKRVKMNRRNYQEEQRAALLGHREDAEVLNVLNDIHDENESLRRSNTLASQSIAQAVEIIQSLRDQGSTLRRAQDKLKEIANVLGLSNSLLRVIERREWGDAMIVYVGMVMTVLFLILVYYLTG